MKILQYNKCSLLVKSFAIFLAVLSLFFYSCKEENTENGFFTIQDNTGVMEVVAAGSSKTFNVQSSGNWKVEPLRKEQWVKVEPMEGNGDGTFTVTVAKNAALESRDLQLFFTVDGKLQNATLKIAQSGGIQGGENGESYIHFDGNPTNLEVPEGGATQNIVLRATGKWKIEVEDQPDWISFSQLEGMGDTPLTMVVNGNTSNARTARILFYLNDVKQSFELPVSQDGTIFVEDFNWLVYGSPVFYTTDGEKIITSWTAAETARGWTSSPSADGSKPVYARTGFVKLGKTNFGADIISPKLSRVQGTKDLLVKFKAVPYKTAAGTLDDTRLTVHIIGPGTIDVSTFKIDNWPDYSVDPTCTAIWQEARTQRSFVITGATSETQIRFMGGDFDLRQESGAPINRNRIFLDDIVVTIKK